LGREGSPSLADAFERAIEDALQVLRRVIHGLAVYGATVPVQAERWPQVWLAPS
jgi:hypothetical protein